MTMILIAKMMMMTMMMMMVVVVVVMKMIICSIYVIISFWSIDFIWGHIGDTVMIISLVYLILYQGDIPRAA